MTVWAFFIYCFIALAFIVSKTVDCYSETPIMAFLEICRDGIIWPILLIKNIAQQVQREIDIKNKIGVGTGEETVSIGLTKENYKEFKRWSKINNIGYKLQQ